MKNALYKFTLFATCAFIMSGCAMREGKQNFAQMSAEDLQSAGARAEKDYNRNPSNPHAALKYAQILRTSGAHQQALGIIEPIAQNKPDDSEIIAEYGRSLAATGQMQNAIIALNRASEMNPSDWKIHSARGAVYDQIGQLPQSRAAYQQALTIVPNEPSVLSNLALSYALSKDLKNANTHISLAAAQPTADSRVRQNQALIAGLSGNLQQAEKLLKAELPADEAEQTLASLKSLLNHSKSNRSWAQLRANQKKNANAMVASSNASQQDEDLNTASFPAEMLDEPNSSKPQVIKAPTWDMLMEKPSIKGKSID